MILESNFPDIQQFHLNCLFLGFRSFMLAIDRIEIIILPIIIILPLLTYLNTLTVYLGLLQIQYLMKTTFDNI